MARENTASVEAIGLPIPNNFLFLSLTLILIFILFFLMLPQDGTC